MPYSVQATVISGKITNWEESSSAKTIGDGVNRVNLYWSINMIDKGWFYRGYDFYDGALSAVAFAAGVTDISQISDASIFNFGTEPIGPYCDADSDPDGSGDFIVWKNMNTGHYGVLRIDDIVYDGMHPAMATLNGTWWFQTNGTGNFSVVPEPSSFLLFLCGQAALGILFKRRATYKS
jgi:hypothetical protein